LTKRPFQALWLALTLFVAACANTPTTTLAPSMGATNLANVQEYVIGAGDVLDIFVWHNSDLTRSIPVRPDGRISMPLVGDTLVVGKTPAALAAELQDKLKPYIIDPLVTVIPTQFVGLFTRQVRVIGEAAQPRALPYRSSMTVLDVMIDVGGLTRYADGDRAVLVRQAAGGQQQSYRVKLDSLVRDGDITQNVDVQPGDILIIPQRLF